MKFECPHCGAKYEESQDVSGQEGECVECGRRFVATPMQESPDGTNTVFREMRRM
jgi:MJ0042 family finger-like domain